MSFKAKQFIKLVKRLFKYLIIYLFLFSILAFYITTLRAIDVPYDDNKVNDDSCLPTESETQENRSFIENVYDEISALATSTQKESNLCECKITILNVGQASCAIIESNGEYMMFDGGDADTSSFIVAYCKAQGITCFKYLVASHYHADHIYGLIGILESDIVVENVICPDYVTDTSAQRALYERVPENERIIPYVSQVFQIGEIEARCIAPVTDEYSDDNGYSVGFVFTYGEFSFLIDGDATQETEQDMLVEDIDVDTDILVVPHHGSTYSSSKEWLDMVSPETAVISCGENNSYYHPHEGTLERLRECGVTSLYRTDLNGTITITSNGETFSVETEKVVTGKEWLPGTGDGSEKSYSGLWEANDGEVESYYIGNTASKKFHRPTCEQLPSEKRQILFSSRNDALKNNYLPCGTCNP